MADQRSIQSAASKSIRPFKSSEEYLYAMKEDLAEWLNMLYDLDSSAETFMESLETGCALCRHANNVNRAALDFTSSFPKTVQSLRMPKKDVFFQSRNVIPGSFLARDNVSNFIGWCRQELGIKDVLMFETNDLVEKCNEKNFVLCLLEVARRGAKFGMLAPMLIQLEEEIEEEIRDQENLREHSPPSKTLSRKESVEDLDPPVLDHWHQKQRVLCDMRNLDELVCEILGQCSCPNQFPMSKVSEGKYKVGDSSALIFIRVLRTHVMVRVGGGWDTLEHYLDKHDPCRCTAFAHRYQQAKASGQGSHSKSSSAHSSRSTSPGPHWRNESAASKTSERHSLEPSGSSSSSLSRQGRSHHPSLFTERESSTGRTGRTPALLSRPNRDHSEPRHFKPFRSKESLVPVTRRLSGGSDSSTASSKGSCGLQRAGGEDVVLLVNRREGRHLIERVGGQDELAALQPPQTRTRNLSRERFAQSSQTPLQHSPRHVYAEGYRTTAYQNDSPCPNSPYHLPITDSPSQDKVRSSCGDISPGAESWESWEDLRSRQATCTHGGYSRRQTSNSASSGQVRGASCNRSGSPAKKGLVTPRPPASPSIGRSRLLPPMSQPGRHSPQSSYRSSHHHHNHPPRSPRSQGSRTSSRPQRSRSNPRPSLQTESQDETSGLGYSLQHLPRLDPQKEEDMYRSFEEEYLINTQQLSGPGPHRGTVGKDILPVPPQLEDQPFTLCALPKPASGDLSVTKSASSSTSSLNDRGKVFGLLPDLKDVKRTKQSCVLNDPTTFLQNPSVEMLSESQQWSDCGRGLKRLPSISSLMKDCDVGFNHSQHLSQAALAPRPMNGSLGLHHRPTEMLLNGHPDLSNGRDVEADVCLEELTSDKPYDLDHNPNDDLPLLTCPSPVPMLTDDSLLQDSSICFSEPPSGSITSPAHSLANGDVDDAAVLRARRGQKNTEWMPSISKMKLRPRVRPRTDNRPENSPSRIPTPVGKRDKEQQQHQTSPPPLDTPAEFPHFSHSNEFSPSRKVLHQAISDLIHPQSCSPSLGPRDCSYSPQSSLDTEACM